MNTALLQERFRENFERRGEIGASFALWDASGPLLSLHDGRATAAPDAARWTSRTLAVLWSATKGLVAAVLLKELLDQGLALGAPVAEVWPAFARNGKETITFASLLSHQAGLFALDEPAPRMDEPEAVLAAIEKQRPAQLEPGRPAYHARTFGHLVDGCVRALSGKPVQQRWAELFQEPLGLDLFLGLPPSELGRFAPPIPPRTLSSDENDKAFYAALARRESPAARAFRTLGGFSTPSALAQPSALAAGLPSMGAVGTADALAKFYAMLANGGRWGGRQFFTPEFLETAARPRASGLDAVLCRPVVFCAGFMREAPPPAPRLFGGAPGAFGQPGAGGIHAFALPSRGLGAAYTMNAMGPGVMPNERALSLVAALAEPA